MKLMIGGYEVEISVRNTMTSYSKNDTDTGFFLNEISMALDEATLSYKKRGRNWLSQATKGMSNDIYNALQAKGFYKDVDKD